MLFTMMYGVGVTVGDDGKTIVVRGFWLKNCGLSMLQVCYDLQRMRQDR
jgi:hypothetical protein